jgi:hypothetical protein
LTVSLSLNVRLAAMIAWAVAACFIEMTLWELLAAIWLTRLLLCAISPEWPEAGVRWAKGSGWSAFANGFRPWRVTRKGWS